MIRLLSVLSAFLCCVSLNAEQPSNLEKLKIEAASQSKYLSNESVSPQANVGEVKADLEGFESRIKPVLQNACVQCHGPDKAKSDFRIDTLDPDLVHGQDVDWWLEIIEVMSNDEMPPPEKDIELSDENRAEVIDWLSAQVLVASKVERSASGHSSFRRMTQYEYSYALQDLLGLPKDFAKNLPPETLSEDGFRNSSENLQMTSQQFTIYREIARDALTLAASKKSAPKPVYFSITMEKGGEEYMEWIENLSIEFRARKANGEVVNTLPTLLNRAFKAAKEEGFDSSETHFLNRETGDGWNREPPEGFSPWEPTEEAPTEPEAQPYVLVIPSGESQLIDVGNHMPDSGEVRVRVRASRASTEGESYPSLSLAWGHDPAKTHSQTLDFEVHDLAVTAPPGKPEFYEWTISMDGLKRNPYLRKYPLFRMPNPSEHFLIRNSHQGKRHKGSGIIIDYIEIIANGDQQQAHSSYEKVFPKNALSDDEDKSAHAVLASFMSKAWRRPVGEKEIDGMFGLYKKMRPAFDTFEETMIEALATVLTSSNFLYLSQSEESVTDGELASRLSFFLWSSLPDEELLALVKSGEISDPEVLAQQAERMLADPRVNRFTGHFTHQWLALEMLDALRLNKRNFPKFSPALKSSMRKEPVVLLKHMLQEDRSIMDFLHADYSYLDQTLARHYGVEGVYGNHFRKVALPPETRRGGLLTQAGLLAMNSDGKDSHPLRRSIWLLESLLHDPPPPPPPAVPEIDLTDPEIMKMTVKERMEDHRNDPACFSCHMKIDPWGIAFEEFDAIGLWRDSIEGKPVEATSQLVDETTIVGMDGLKRYLLENRQDQFARAMVHKVACYALGRPLRFSDHAEIERITAETRKNGDGLKTLIMLLVQSDLFRNS